MSSPHPRAGGPRWGVGFATSREEAPFTADDRLALEPLRQRGVEVVPVVWSDDRGEEGALDALVLRSRWDSHLQPSAFAAWLAHWARLPVPLYNPAPLLGWNLHKRYLLELEARGVPVPRTAVLPRGSLPSLRTVIAEAGIVGSAVLKPAISLNGHDTLLLRDPAAPAAQAQLERLLSRGDVLVQAFVPEILTGGEVSLVFFDGAFSHALRKRPGPGEFRVQVEHGGVREPYRPGAEEVRQAQACLDALGTSLLYARVDGVLVGGTLVLMELELVDPMLFLGYAPHAAERFAQALVDRLLTQA